MGGNYQRVPVGVSKWGPNSDPDNPMTEFTGEIEEFYHENGSLVLIIEHPEENTVTDIQIPIQAKDSWNEFVDSLPAWE